MECIHSGRLGAFSAKLPWEGREGETSFHKLWQQRGSLEGGLDGDAMRCREVLVESMEAATRDGENVAH